MKRFNFALLCFLMLAIACNRHLVQDDSSLLLKKINLSKEGGLLDEIVNTVYLFEYKKQLDNFFDLSHKAADGDIQSILNFKKLIESDSLTHSLFSLQVSNMPEVLRTIPPIKLDIYPSAWRTAANRLDLLFPNKNRVSWNDKSKVFMLNRIVILEDIIYLAKYNSLRDFSEGVNFYSPKILGEPAGPDIPNLNDLPFGELINKIPVWADELQNRLTYDLLQQCEEVIPDVCFSDIDNCKIDQAKCETYEKTIEGEMKMLPKITSIEPREICSGGMLRLRFLKPLRNPERNIPSGWKIPYADIISWGIDYVEIKLDENISSTCFPLKWQKEVPGRIKCNCKTKVAKIYQESIGEVVVFGSPFNFQAKSKNCSETVVSWDIFDYECYNPKIETDKYKVKLVSYLSDNQSIPDKTWNNFSLEGNWVIPDVDQWRYYQLIITAPCGIEYYSEKVLVVKSSYIRLKKIEPKVVSKYEGIGCAVGHFKMEASIDCPAPVGGLPLSITSSSSNPLVTIKIYTPNVIIPEGKTSVEFSAAASSNDYSDVEFKAFSNIPGYLTGTSSIIRIRRSCNLAQIPALESISFLTNNPSPSQYSVASQNTDGSYSITFPTEIINFTVRAFEHTKFEVLMNGIALQEVANIEPHPEFDQQGFYMMPFGYGFASIGDEPAEYYYSIKVVPPFSLRSGTLLTPIDVEIRNVSYDNLQKKESLFLRLNTNPAIFKEEPNTVFDHGHNSKDFQNPWPGGLDRHSLWSIVARKVSIAGWLIEAPGRNDGTSKGLGSGQSEDWHYKIIIDNDYLDRNYGNDRLPPGGSSAEPNELPFPLLNKVLPGHPTDKFPFTNPSFNDIPFVHKDHFGMDAGVFLLPNQDHFWGELNAWHKSVRGTPPTGWVDDPNPTYTDNAWPFDPMQPYNGQPLRAGDYVIISGTLWQDSGHLINEPPEKTITARCWQYHFYGQEGWLEIHPVDMVRRERAPTYPPIKPTVVSICTMPNEAPVDTIINIVPLQPRSGNKVLRYSVFDDKRFTKQHTINKREESIFEGVNGPSLRVHLNVGDNKFGGCFKAVYLVWWD